MEPAGLLPHSQMPATCLYPGPARYQISSLFFIAYVAPQYQSRSEAYSLTVRDMMRFYGEDLLAPRPTPKLQDHTLLAVREEVSLSQSLKCASAEKKKIVRPSVCPSSKRNRNINLQSGSLDVMLCRGFAVQVAL